MAMSARLLQRSVTPTSLHQPSVLLPAFLLPCFSAPLQSTNFSTSAPLSVRVRSRRDANKDRGVSALRRTGLNKRQVLTVNLANLPQPVLDPAMRSKVQVDEDHGLWQFFNAERTPFATPAYNDAHGRAWTVSELRLKNWDDLWGLWWACVKERNRLATEEYERDRVGAGYGRFEAEDRDSTVKTTMKAIRRVLTERWYAWQDARELAKSDPNINLYPAAGGSVYSPSTTEVDYVDMPESAKA